MSIKEVLWIACGEKEVTFKSKGKKDEPSRLALLDRSMILTIGRSSFETIQWRLEDLTVPNLPETIQ